MTSQKEKNASSRHVLVCSTKDHKMFIFASRKRLWKCKAWRL